MIMLTAVSGDIEALHRWLTIPGTDHPSEAALNGIT